MIDPQVPSAASEPGLQQGAQGGTDLLDPSVGDSPAQSHGAIRGLSSPAPKMRGPSSGEQMGGPLLWLAPAAPQLFHSDAVLVSASFPADFFSGVTLGNCPDPILVTWGFFSYSTHNRELPVERQLV